jgi:subtilisin family serine protease
MVGNTRRTFVKSIGGVIGAAAVGGIAAGADATKRFIVDAKRLRGRSDFEVVHELQPVDLLVVEATEGQLADAGVDYAPDPRISPKPFAPVRTEPLEAGESRSSHGDEGLFAYQWDKQHQRIPDAHEMTRGEGTRIAIIDSGIATGHPELEGQVNLDLSKNFSGDDFGVGEPYAGSHGTHVAGIAAASDENETGLVGSAPGAELVDLRVFSPRLDGSGDSRKLPPDYWRETYMGNVMAALVYATEIDADVANLSLGWTWLMRWEGWNRFWGTVMQRVGNYARSNGTLHAHACGNWGGSLQFNQDQTDSSEVAGGLTVSATGPIGFDPETGDWIEPPYTPATYTNHGVGAVDLGAPGGQGGEYSEDNVVNATAFPRYENGEYLGADYGYGWWAGTSMAAPQVAGAVALVKSANPRYNANQVTSALKRGAYHPEEYERKYYGSGGYLDTYAALEASHAGRK